MMWRKYSPLPVMRHKFPAKLWFSDRNIPLLVPLGVRIERSWHLISDEGDGWRGRYWISPERHRKRFGWVARCPVRREEEISAMWVAHKLSLHEPTHPPTPTAVHRPTRRSEVSGPQEIDSIQQWCYHQRGRSRLCLGALCHLPRFKIPFFVTSSSASAASYRNIHSKLRSTMWLANRAAWGTLPSLIPGHTQNK